VTFSKALTTQQGANCEHEETATMAEESSSGRAISWEWSREQGRV